jgi:pimeloyl-ACP methyl ester carboxylesterase
MPLRYYSRPFYLATAKLLAGGQAERDPEFVSRSGDARLRFPPSILGYLAQVSALAQWSSWPWLHEIDHPTLVVHGEDDPVAPPANGTILAHRMPNARMCLRHDEGHFFLLDPNSSAIPEIAEFLAATPLSASRVWKDAAVVDDIALSDALRATRHAAQPLAAMSALVRAAAPAA